MGGDCALVGGVIGGPPRSVGAPPPESAGWVSGASAGGVSGASAGGVSGGSAGGAAWSLPGGVIGGPPGGEAAGSATARPAIWHPENPAIIHATGFGHKLPTGEGLIAFQTVQEALDACARSRRTTRGTPPRRVASPKTTSTRASSLAHYSSGLGCDRRFVRVVDHQSSSQSVLSDNNADRRCPPPPALRAPETGGLRRTGAPSCASVGVKVSDGSPSSDSSRDVRGGCWMSCGIGGGGRDED